MPGRYRGHTYGTLLRKLPRNLVVFDGHCLLCQARVQYVLERNFSYFSLLNLSQNTDEAKLAANKMLFCSFDSAEWREIRRHFPQLTTCPEGVVLIEKVPSKTATFLYRVRDRRRKSINTRHSNNSSLFPFTSSSVTSSSNSSSSIGTLFDAGKEEDLDILISVKYEAVCRMGMKLDRWLPRTVFRCLYYTIPQWMGNRWYDYVMTRRRLWGTSEEDAVKYPKRVLGLKERTWKLRST
ncbi:hypothetical protein LSM04_007597 [Trypanosoma melophagium]|uniref:uncharacterized protein n=1 Tax=Trypanosoma melophagium TaxID=715481 RepID=UPI00351AADCA|nr:hypothetical protein LSM04_007597 [Trypanosoma melophagium]